MIKNIVICDQREKQWFGVSIFSGTSIYIQLHTYKSLYVEAEPNIRFTTKSAIVVLVSWPCFGPSTRLYQGLHIYI
jgi:hypothetical protein